MNALLEEDRLYNGFWIPCSDVQSVLDVDIGHSGYGGILCYDKWPVACTWKVREVAPSEGDEVVPAERIL